VIQGELRQFIRRRFNVGNNPITCIAASQYSSRLVAVGNSNGYVRIIDLKYGDDSDLFDQEEGVEYAPIPEGTDYKTLLRSRLFPTAVEKVIFDPSGKFLLCVSGNGTAFILEVYSEFKVLGSVEYSGDFQSATWNYEESEEKELILHFYIMATKESFDCSYIHKYTMQSISPESLTTEEGSWLFSKSSILVYSYFLSIPDLDIPHRYIPDRHFRSSTQLGRRKRTLLHPIKGRTAHGLLWILVITSIRVFFWR
jgi:WD40 repeat protein